MFDNSRHCEKCGIKRTNMNKCGFEYLLDEDFDLCHECNVIYGELKDIHFKAFIAMFLGKEELTQSILETRNKLKSLEEDFKVRAIIKIQQANKGD